MIVVEVRWESPCLPLAKMDRWQLLSYAGDKLKVPSTAESLLCCPDGALRLWMATLSQILGRTLFRKLPPPPESCLVSYGVGDTAVHSLMVLKLTVVYTQPKLGGERGRMENVH